MILKHFKTFKTSLFPLRVTAEVPPIPRMHNQDLILEFNYYHTEKKKKKNAKTLWKCLHTLLLIHINIDDLIYLS